MINRGRCRRRPIRLYHGYRSRVSFRRSQPKSLSVTAGFLPWEDFYWSCIEASILESNAEKVAIPPNQSAFANRSEIVKGQFELKRYELAILTPYASSDICDVADSAMMRTRFLAKKNQRAFVDFRPADRSAFERAFPSLEAI
jgi:hypothetical protein